MASRQDCDAAVGRLSAALDGLDPSVRRKVIPPRQVALVVSDLGIAYTARLDGDGVHDCAPTEIAAATAAPVRFTAASDELVRISLRPASFLSAWLRGRVSVHAGVRDLFHLRKLL